MRSGPVSRTNCNRNGHSEELGIPGPEGEGIATKNLHLAEMQILRCAQDEPKLTHYAISDDDLQQ